MNRFRPISGFKHDSVRKTAVLLVNLGTPAAPTPRALRHYLAEFLSDRRVVEIPRLLWWIILHGVILRTRPKRSAAAYKKIWTELGSPLLVHSSDLADALQQKFSQQYENAPIIKLAMRYGRPAIDDAMQQLQKEGADKFLILPLYPQYSATTTASVFDAVSDELQQWRYLPSLRVINRYHDFLPYIDALAKSVEKHWQKNGRAEKLVMSFHGIPKRNLMLGDPYYCECQKTARLLAETLQLKEEQFILTFQSRFGKAEWLQPYTDKTLQILPAEGVKSVDIICPGFAVDCLETLEEIAEENREYFLQAGGEQYSYIPALNSSVEHVEVLHDLIQREIKGWESSSNTTQTGQTLQRALKAGALE